MSHLDHLAREIFAKLELSASPKAANIYGCEATSKGKSDGGDGPAWVEAPHDYFRGRYLACKTDERRREILFEAIAEVNHYRHAQIRVDHKTIQGKITIGIEPLSVKETARVYGVTQQVVRDCRVEAVKHGHPAGDGRRGARLKVS